MKHASKYFVFSLSLLLAACGGGGSSGGSSGSGSSSSSSSTSSSSGGPVEPPPEPPQAPVLSWEPRQTKKFHFSWDAVDNVDEYHLLENVDGNSGFEPVGPESIDGGAAEFDLTVFLPEKVNASYILEACNEGGCTESDPVAVSGNLAEAVGYFKASNTDEGDNFGAAIALSADGGTLAIAARNEKSAATGVNGDQEDNTRLGNGAGAVYVFRLGNGVWVQQAYLKPSNTVTGIVGDFGTISVSADGNTIAVGATEESSSSSGLNGNQNNSDLLNSGAVYLFSFSNQAWRQEAYVKASNPGYLANFGSSVVLSRDGKTLVVGAPRESSSSTDINGEKNENAKFSGAVYIFNKSSDGWQEDFYIKASNTGEGDRFGNSIALSGDSRTLVVGAPSEDSLSSGVNGDQHGNEIDDESTYSVGAVYVFIHEGETWAQEAYLKASNPERGDAFGISLAVSEDGNTLAVGADSEDSAATGINGDESNNNAKDSGAVYVFERNDGVWSQESYLKASNTDGVEANTNAHSEEMFNFGDRFGYELGMSADGKRLVVSAVEEYGSARGIDGDETDNSSRMAGAVYLFSRKSGGWRQSNYIKASNIEEGDRFGSSVALAEGGQLLAIGARWEDSEGRGINSDQEDNSQSNAGAVYLY